MDFSVCSMHAISAINFHLNLWFHSISKHKHKLINTHNALEFKDGNKFTTERLKGIS
jgi:hypothetical protein